MGGILKKYLDFVFGKKGKVKQAKTTTKDQDEVNTWIKEAIESGTGPLADIFKKFDPEEFKQMVANPAIEEFNEDILPSIRHKYLSQGAGQSSAIDRASVRGANKLQNDLNKLQFDYKNQNTSNRNAAVQSFTGAKNVENFYQQPVEGTAQAFIKGFLPTAAKIATGGVAG